MSDRIFHPHARGSLPGNKRGRPIILSESPPPRSKRVQGPAALTERQESDSDDSDKYKTTLSGARELLKMTVRQIKNLTPDNALDQQTIDFLAEELRQAGRSVQPLAQAQYGATVASNEKSSDAEVIGAAENNPFAGVSVSISTKKDQYKGNDNWRPIKHYPAVPKPSVSPIGSPVPDDAGEKDAGVSGS